ncbi:MAG: uracil-DNA glycosylase [Proteobacteria bacterium]|nr:uracil-DNA glycosylase [Pseudomonadota bacterium]
MDNYSPERQFDRLEKALRLTANNTNWLPLEAVDKELFEDLQGLVGNGGNANKIDKAPEQNRKTISRDTEQSRISTTKIGKELPDKRSNENLLRDKTIDLSPEHATSLDSLRLRIKDCDRCRLCLGRKTIVFGQGNLQAELLFIGEGPGEEEDKKGLAFVGKAGRLLTQIIQSVGINREAVYICNVVKCRPPGNRNPVVEEISACSPFLFKQIELLKPKLIVSMGNIATKTLLPDAFGIMKMRGKLTQFRDIPLIPTFHPSFLLRNPSAISAVWDDMRQIRQFLFKSTSDRPGNESKGTI